MNTTRPVRRAHGFTLLEVLVALAVAALSLGAGLRAAGVLTDNAQRLKDVMFAQWCADNQLTELRLSRQMPGAGVSDFSCQQLGVVYQGKLVVQPTPNASFVRVDAEVSDAEGTPLVSVTMLGSRR